ncbi:MAG TPA: methyltransferase domain-containing protein [Gemmataceae bacterium]|nr:methyltransferase domain-containing protein [Gemmataceae bacterium]
MVSERTPYSWDPKLYDSRHSFVWKHVQSLFELLAPQARESILDLGCGTGHLTAQLAATGASVLGIDPSTEMIEAAQRSYPGLSFEMGDARYLTYVQQFDAVFSNAVLHWVPETERVAKSIFRALKPGGRFVAELGGHGNVRAILVAMQKELEATGHGLVESPWFFPSVGEYASLLETAGLEVTFATLFERPTPLEGRDGMRHWIRMFAGHFLRQVPEDEHEPFFHQIEERLRPVLYRDGSWFADYRRLRVVAWRQNADSE